MLELGSVLPIRASTHSDIVLSAHLFVGLAIGVICRGDRTVGNIVGSNSHL